MIETKHTEISRKLEARINACQELDKLPSVRLLSEELNVSTRTMGKALKPLIAKGLIIPGPRGCQINRHKHIRRKTSVVAIFANENNLVSTPDPLCESLKTLIRQDGLEPLMMNAPDPNQFDNIDFWSSNWLVFKFPAGSEDIVYGKVNFIIGGKTPAGHTQVSSQLTIRFEETGSKKASSIIIDGQRYNRNRRFKFESGKEFKSMQLNYPVDTLLTLKLFYRQRDGKFLSMLCNADTIIFFTDWQTANMGIFRPDTLKIIVSTVSGNDGLMIPIKNVRIQALSVAETEKLTNLSSINNTSPCSTLPRQYVNINPKLYNSSFVDIIGDNLADRIGAADPATAEQLMKSLADLKINGGIYSGRHFRINFVDEFPTINQAAKILSTAARKYGISLIEHHDPTIFSYRGYPMMINNLDYLQRDVRSGESSFWACPVNPVFRQFYFDFLARLQATAEFDGFMIDEFVFANRNACACDSCRIEFKKDAKLNIPAWLDANNPGAVEQRFNTWKEEKIVQYKCDALRLIQDIKKDSTLMIYCSDYGDPVSRAIELTQIAANCCSFVGWENMIYDPLNSWTSYLRCLKMRNGYGDFYDIPIWSLNRETVSREASYLGWAMCQGGRHSIWYSGHVPLDTPADKQFFKTYNSWAKRMSHDGSRYLTDTGVLHSSQTLNMSADRSFFWYEYCGYLDTLLRNNRQFDSLLDGDLFYGGRLNKYKVLILPAQAALSDQQCDNLTQFVNNGGTAIVTRYSSLYNHAGMLRTDLKLGEAMNLRYIGDNLTNLTITNAKQPFKTGAKLPLTLTVALIDPAKSKILAESQTAAGRTIPLIVETPYGKGRFIYVASDIASPLFEMEMRNGRTYNYADVPDLSKLIVTLYDYAHQAPAPVTFDLPGNVVALANQMQKGDRIGDIFIHLYNFTGQSIKKGEKRSYGVPEKIVFPPIKQDLHLTINTPCSKTGTLSAPFSNKDMQFEGVQSGDATTFTIPGKYLENYALFEVKATAKPEMAIIPPPMKIEKDGRKFALSHKEADIEQYFDQPKTKIEFSNTPHPDSEIFQLTGDRILGINNHPIIVKDQFQIRKSEIGELLSSGQLDPAINKTFKIGNTTGILSSGKTIGVPYIREAAILNSNTSEITLAATLMPADHRGRSFGYAFSVPVSTLRGAHGKYMQGMHRSNKSSLYKFTGNEKEGDFFLAGIRNIQFTGGTVDFSFDFAVEGPWGLFLEDHMSQYKANIYRQGDNYIFCLLNNASGRFGLKYSTKIVIRSGTTDFYDIHPITMTYYQYNRPATYRLQFTNGAAAMGFAIPSIKDFKNEFEAVSFDKYALIPGEAPIRTVNDNKLGPLFSSAAVKNGKATLKLPHYDGVVLVNLLLTGAFGEIKGSANSNGKNFNFDVKDGDKKTLVYPAYIKGGVLFINLSGNWALSGIVIQPLMSDKEDYFFTRSWWNCQKAPWLLEEMKQNPGDWQFWSDTPYRRAKWVF